MYSFAFPNMLDSSFTSLLEGRDAVKSNLRLLLNSERLSLFGDPYFGTRLKVLLFEQSASIVVDLLIDEIYTTIITFIPQIFLTRKDITISTDGTDLFAHIQYVYRPENIADLYVINLTTSEYEEK